MAGPKRCTGTGPLMDGSQECGVEALSANHDAQPFCDGVRASLCERSIGDNGGVVSMIPDQAATTTAPAARTRIMMDIAPSLSAGSPGGVFAAPRSMYAPARHHCAPEARRRYSLLQMVNADGVRNGKSLSAKQCGS